ncbi:hypothetical protein ACVXG7_30850 [Enterobacter hormaechei]
MGDTDYSYPVVVEKQHSVGVVNEHLRYRDFHLAAYSAAHAEKAASKAMDKSEGASQKANQTANSLQGNARQAH